MRWAAVEAVQRVRRAHPRSGSVRDQVAARRGRNIGVVAAARELTDAGLLRAARRPRSAALAPCPRRRSRRHEQPPRPRWARVVQVMTPEHRRRGRPV